MILRHLRFDDQWVILCDPDNHPAQVGQFVFDENMGEWEITGGAAPHKFGRTGLVYVRNKYGVDRRFYPVAFDLVWVEEKYVHLQPEEEKRYWSVEFAVQITVEAANKAEAVQNAREVAHSDSLNEYWGCDDDPICVHKLDENGDPIVDRDPEYVPGLPGEEL